MLTRLERVYSVGMAEFTREEILEKVAAEESLEGADLRGANLSRADLSEANLSEANLSRANLSDAKYSANTKWPVGFDPVAAGAVLVEDDD